MECNKPSKKVIFGGTGICSISHLTRQVEGAIKSADIVLYLVNEPVMDAWINKCALNCLSLESIYFSKELRVDSYNLIAEKILQTIGDYNFVCIVVYGHPLLLSNVVSTAIEKIKNKVDEIKVLPGISSFDCMLADLHIDPIYGCLSIDASTLLIKNKRLDVTNHTILWQIGVVLNRNTIDSNMENLNIESLKLYLEKFYGLEHDFYIYEAALYPYLSSKIIKTTISELEISMLSSISTGYIPPRFN